jgi:bifunctional non-homologous end joining protein LigD
VIGDHQAVLDGELVVLDADGRSLFYDLLRRRHPPVFVAFDLLFLDGEDLRELPLLERKRRLSALVPEQSSSLLYAQHVIGAGRALFDQVRALDLEGIVAKLAAAPYRRTVPPHWIKIKNPAYSQAEGRHEFFETRRE